MLRACTQRWAVPATHSRTTIPMPSSRATCTTHLHAGQPGGHEVNSHSRLKCPVPDAVARPAAGILVSMRHVRCSALTRRSLVLLAVPACAARAQRIPDVRALTFDVFGTVVDWRSSLIREGEALGRSKGLQVDWAAFADSWRDGYGPAMHRVRTGDLPWKTIDELHRMILDELIERFAIEGLSEREKDNFNRAWHRLTPWPDAVEGLSRLRSKYVVASLSNGNVSLLKNMGEHAGLPWDVVLSAELAGRYKPDREVYLKAAELLDLVPRTVMMVAAHKGDLRAAAAAGFRTAFVPRPLERPNRRIDLSYDRAFDVNARDFLELADLLGVPAV